MFVKIQLNIKQKGREDHIDQPHEWWEILKIEEGTREVIEEGELIGGDK